MNALNLVTKLEAILINAQVESETFMQGSSLPMTERFEASRSVECAALRTQIKQLASDLEALEQVGQ